MDDLSRRGLSRLTTRDQVSLALLAMERAGRGALARMRRSRLLRWRYRSATGDELLLAPPDLRAADPSFADEAASGSFGLAGFVANLNGRSPFSVRPPSPQWARELHGFGWLRHLAAAQTEEAHALAHDLVGEWIRRRRRHAAPAWEPDVVARRIVSWLSHAGLLLDAVDRRRYGAVMTSLADQATHLSASWRNAPDGYPRLVSLIALVCADLCMSGHGRRLAQSERLLAAELERQVLADGGHLTRNPAVLIELLLDMLPLRQCFATRGEGLDRHVTGAVARMTAMLRHLRLGDGMLARFNGMGATERDVLATLLAYSDGEAATGACGGYVRIVRGRLVAVLDAGAAPALPLAGAACAGCLSFELSTGSELLFVNAGMPGPREASRRAVARATASHNTLCLGEQSSARLMRDARLERVLGAPPLAHPDHVTCELREKGGGGIEIEASHDGYVEHFGLVHTRRLALDADGTRIAGCDRLDAAKGIVRFAWDVPFAIHFHLHPDAEARVGPSPDTALLILDSGEQWRLTAAGAALSIEESVHFAEPAGARPASQVVLRAQCCGTTEVTWTLERIKSGQSGSRRKQRSTRPLSERLAETIAGFEAER
jgi:uncharacterized heparinase superfamily protein